MGARQVGRGAKIDHLREKLFPDEGMRTERLFIRPLQPADAFQLVVLTNDPLVAAGVSFLRQPFTIADAQDLIGLPGARKGCFGVVRAGADGPMIGCVGAVARSANDIEIGFWLGAPFHGRHYGAEMARAMLERLREVFPERRVIAECPRENAASWRLLRKLGFTPSGASGARRGSQLLVYEAPAVVE
ncbi:GNAT family N-acetyltransferase [Rhodoblastus acidophilus]|uniref:GNAT family N-acetyltransferase n=1 Tax=Candidatus Rhodoblastus alkanivorans TaxID=2954117 RepID=A0ABS9Z8J0_9HYPH|nr:GNAT family N-acetyltransferase [Candidatus Rhodoblastus alkanivorans]MCI4678987.1 GNAT family N-acetyltransferase [Candidatus Rhodoblastus alkanivorans]MCI4683765.1 GNAT family N-acetyltransferase [Candidatus Rhodoblastus alkanivorans]MDI4641083.1 GNAT family N-acetyltransferase [Rhodoblastus acidophilus]